jgi:hypothetical protein
MASMVDLERACRTAGLPADPPVPDWLTNGHNGVPLLDKPRLGYWHHTVSKVLQSVYTWAGQDEWRPDVPSPRCNVYAARARAPGCGPHCRHPGIAHLVFVSAGKAHHAGMAVLSRIQTARAGRVTAALPDATGLADDYASASFEAVGLEVDWAEGEGWPADLLDLVAAFSAVAVRTFGWDGPGHWIHHRQATGRKPDMAYRGDLWAAVHAQLDGGPLMALSDSEQAEVLGAARQIRGAVGAGQTTFAGTIAATLGNIQNLVNLLNAKAGALGAAIGDSKAAVLGAVAALPTDHLSDDDRRELAEQIAGMVPGADSAAVLDALAVRLAS